MDLSVVLPAYKEAENLQSILPRINDVLKNEKIQYEILVIDTMDPFDDTEEICIKNKARYINRENGNMYGDAIRTGIEYSTGKFTLIMDADGSHDPADIVRLYNEMSNGDYDIVIGSRYCKGGNTDNNIILKSMSWALNLTYRVAFGLLKIKDISNSFRMYRSDEIKHLKLDCENFDIVEEILIKLNNAIDALKVKEIPIHFNKRDKGESKRDLIKFIISYLKTMNRLMRIKSGVR